MYAQKMKGWLIIVEFNGLKVSVISICGIIGSFIAEAFGGWDAALQTLFIFMVIDYISGLLVAGVFHKSKKSENGTLESKAGFKGLCKKGMILVLVLVGHRLDLTMGLDYVKNGVIIGFLVNETFSILENAGLMGIPLPAIIKNSLDVLQKKVINIGS
jgi:toxin secretion/phage lysis holin